jgi:hypothetical protein
MTVIQVCSIPLSYRCALRSVYIELAVVHPALLGFASLTPTYACFELVVAHPALLGFVSLTPTYAHIEF